MEFARRRPLLSAPFGALLGAVVAVALLPCHCEAADLHCLDYTKLDGRFIDGFENNKPQLKNCTEEFEEDKKKAPELEYQNPDTCAVAVCQHKGGKHTFVAQLCAVVKNLPTFCDSSELQSDIKKETKIDGNWPCKCAHSKTNQGRDFAEYYPPWYAPVAKTTPSFAARPRVLPLIVALLVPMAIVHVVFN